MRDIYFEELIREKLHNLEVPFNLDDWKEMEDVLDELDGMEDVSEEDSSKQENFTEEIAVTSTLLTDFDQEIATKLENITETPVPDDWDLFSSKLDGDIFDQAIKDKINQVPIPDTPQDWELLSSKLDVGPIDLVFRDTLADYKVPFYSPDWLLLSETLNRPFDLAIQEKLANLTLRMPAKDWRIMSGMIDKTMIPYQQIPWYANWRNYASYASVLVLLWFSFLGIQNNQRLTRGEREYVEYHAPVYEESTPGDLHSEETDAIRAELNRFGTSDNPKVINDQIEESVEKAQSVFRSQLPIALNQKKIDAKDDLEVLTLISKEKADEIKARFRDIRVEKNIASISKIKLQVENPLISDKLKLSQRGVHRYESGWQKNRPKLRIGGVLLNNGSKVDISGEGKLGYQKEIIEENDDLEVLTQISKDKDNEIEAQLRDIRVEDNIASISKIKLQVENPLISDKLSQRGVHRYESDWQKSRPKLRVGLFLANNGSRVELSDAGKLGYMASARVELIIKDEFSIITGLGYSYKRINHEFQYFVSSLSLQLDRSIIAELEMVEIPLLLRYNFPTQNRLHLYAQGGAVMAISLKEDYKFIDKSNSSSSFGTRSSGASEERKFNTYVGNIYAAAGFEYKLNQSLSLQIEPYIQMNMQKTQGSKAVGQEKPLYSTGLGIGLFYNLNKSKTQ